MFGFLVISCGNSKLNNEERKIINKVKSEVKEFKKNPSKEKAEELFKKGEIQNEKKTMKLQKCIMKKPQSLYQWLTII